MNKLQLLSTIAASQNMVSALPSGKIMKQWLLHLLMFVTMSRILTKLDVPPLQNKIVLAERKPSVTKRDMDLHYQELKCIKWECGTTEWSRNWGTSLRDMVILIKQQRMCVTIPSQE